MNGRLENELKIEAGIERRLKEMPEYVSEWYRELSGYMTAASRKDYVSRIFRFLSYINASIMDVTIQDITVALVRDYIDHSRYKKKEDGEIQATSNSYQNGIRWCLNNFFEFLVNNGEMKENPLNKIKIRNTKKDEVVRPQLTDEDFVRILRAAAMEQNFVKQSRDMAILYLFMTTGMRETALCNINVEDIDFEERTLTVIDKGEKVFHYTLTDKTLRAIQDWLRFRKADASRHELFISQKGTRISPSAVDDMVKKYSKRGLGYSLSPHKLRGGFCSIVYKEKGDIEFVRRAVGHRSTATTMKYITTDNSEQKAAASLMDDIL